MGKGSHIASEKNSYSWSEITSHTGRNDCWIVINGEVYDVTSWSSRHPGGRRIIKHYAGQDATDAFNAFHKHRSRLEKYLKIYKIGQVEDGQYQRSNLDNDFEKLRTTTHAMDLYKPSLLFFGMMLGHILLLDVLAYMVVWYYGTGWLPYIAAVLIMATMQAQAGWLQHDFGHRSVFKSTMVDSVIHHFVVGFLKGASARWWNSVHYQHHAKPNIIDKDPDIHMEQVFVLGEVMPKRMAKEKNTMPYNYQHNYFHALGPPLVLTLVYHYTIFRHIFTRKNYLDLFLVIAFFAKLYYLYMPYYGILGTFVFYMVFRCVESHWFTWVTQSNHIPMEVEDDAAKPWVKLQMHATCNIEKSFFNDWFTGHLNFQIEHHLFPRMPRHNLYKIAPLVKSMCEKHGVPYSVKTLGSAFADIIRSLKHSGEIWKHAYQHLHCD